MSGISRVLRGALMALAAVSMAFGVFAQDAQTDAAKGAAPEAFRQMDGAEKMPKPNAFTAPTAPVTTGIFHTVKFEARLTKEGKPVEQGLIWSIFSPNAGPDDKLPLVATFTGGPAQFQLAAGDYFVNVAFGRAGATKRLSVPESGDVEEQVLVLDAGGLVLNAVSGPDMRIPPDDLSFTIYSSDIKEDGERGLVMDDVNPNEVVRLNAGTYHVVSEYGDINAVIRADIQVDAGKLTKAVLQHKAAQISLKLCTEAGGEALADTAWSVLTSAGDTISESVSPYPTVVLSEGQYTAVARNKDKIYQRDFKVEAGKNTEVEVITSINQHKQDPDSAFFAD